MRKTTLIFILMLSWALRLSANQDPLYTQFMTNPFLVNPAVAGTYPYYQIITNSRLQWQGMDNAPLTNVISMFGPTVSQPMGLGGYIMSDITGITSTTSIKLSYAYNYGITEDLKISMGLHLGASQYKIEGTGTTLEYDPVYNGNAESKFHPDASLGLYVYSSVYHGGIAISKLLGNKLQVGADTITGLHKLKQHVYIHGGYKYLINREFAVEPTIILRKVAATPLQVDFNVRAWYGKRQWERTKVWAGFSYRSQDALTILVGLTYQRKIDFGYSYDIGLNKLRPYHNGTHEVMIGFKFNDIKDY